MNKTNTELLHLLRTFLSAEDKPSEVLPIDLLLVTRLLLQGSDEQATYLSQATLATQLKCGDDAIAQSQKRLEKLGWLSVSRRKHQGRTNRCVVLDEKLPAADLRKPVVSPEAKQIAVSYYRWLRTRHKKPTKGFLQTAPHTIQGLIKRTGGDAKRVYAVIYFAMTNPERKYLARAEKGPSELKKYWPTLMADYDRSTTKVVTVQREEEKVNLPQNTEVEAAILDQG